MHKKLQRKLDYGSINGSSSELALPRLIPAELNGKNVDILMPFEKDIVYTTVPNIEFELCPELLQHPCEFQRAFSLKNGGVAIVRRDLNETQFKTFYISSIPPVAEDTYLSEISRTYGIGRNVVGHMTYGIRNRVLKINSMLLYSTIKFGQNCISVKGKSLSPLLFYYMLHSGLDANPELERVVLDSRVPILLSSTRVKELTSIISHVNVDRNDFFGTVDLISDELDELLEDEELTFGFWKQFGFNVSRFKEDWNSRSKINLVPCSADLKDIIVK